MDMLKNNIYNAIEAFLKRCLVIIKNYRSKLKVSIEKFSELHFEDLTPLDNLKKDLYSDSIKWAIEQKKLKNIALIGNYGSGKSSILRSFEKLHPSFKYLNISLASFHEIDNEEEQEINDYKSTHISVSKIQHRLIERSILQQIFYKVSPNEIPYSRFKRINILGSKTAYKYSAILFVWVFTLLLSLHESLRLVFVPSSIIEYDKLVFLCLILFQILFAIIIASKIIRFFHGYTFSKFNITKGEIELSKNSDSSILNKYLDEIFYFFETTSYNVVVIEDLDRFKDPTVFIKLREINNLLNQSNQINRKISFIYAINDEIFGQNKRTKFFDFIIPVIPIISSSNSVEQLLLTLNKSNQEAYVDTDFLAHVSKYIIDMRLVKNICNEFQIFSRKFKGVNLDASKMFALVVYKNLDPKDFSLLCQDKGILYSILNSKQKLITNLKENIEQQIEQLKQTIDSLNSQIASNTLELNKIYLYELLKKSKNVNAKGLAIGNSYYDFNRLEELNIFNLFRKENLITWAISTNQFSRSKLSFKDLEMEIDQDMTYDDKYKKIESKNTETKKLKGSLARLKLRLNNIEKQSLQDFIRDNIIEDEILNDNGDATIIKYFLVNGYIDEYSYTDYLSYFYEGTLTKEDYLFIRSVRDRRSTSLDFNYNLSNVEIIAKRLNLNDFDRLECLNYNLIEYLLQFNEKFNEQIESIANTISNYPNESQKFVELCLNQLKSEYQQIFFPKLFDEWSDILSFYLIPEMDIMIKKKLVINVLLCRNKNLITMLDKDSNMTLTSFLTEHESIINEFWNEKYQDNLVESLLELNFKLKTLKLKDKLSGYKILVANNLYQLNQSNISFIFQNSNIKQRFDGSYSSIIRTNINPLIEYVNSDLQSFIENCFLKIENKINEPESGMVYLLNSEILDLNLKEELIKKFKNRINSLIGINDIEVKRIIVKNNAMVPIWENVLYFYEISKNDEDVTFIDEPLLSFLQIENNYENLSKEKIDSNDEYTNEDIIQEVSLSLIQNNDFSFSTYSVLLKSVPFNYESLDLKNLNDDKILALIENRIIVLNNNNFSNVRDHNEDLLIEFVKLNLNEFIEEFEALNINVNLIKQIITNNSIKIQSKHEILKKYQFEVMDIDLELANILVEYFQEESIAYWEISLIYEVFVKSDLTDKKINLLLSNVRNLSNNEIKEILKHFEEPYSNLVISSKRPLVKRTKKNEELIKTLKDRGFVSSFYDQQDSIRVNVKKQIN